jgi:hypothetical protein
MKQTKEERMKTVRWTTNVKQHEFIVPKKHREWGETKWNWLSEELERQRTQIQEEEDEECEN